MIPCLAQAVKVTDVFARVSPEHKMRIVDALRSNDEVVAMTGDGVNDAPAIKRADIGVAMGITGTDVAKETADMVLTDDNYVSIVAAVEQGRVIYANIRKFVFFLLSSNVAEIMIIFLATIAGLPMPLTAIQLVVAEPADRRRAGPGAGHGKGRSRCDGTPSAAQARSRSLTAPCDWALSSRPLHTLVQPWALSCWVCTGTWAARRPAGEKPCCIFAALDWRGVDVQTAETMAFVTLSLCELFRAYTVRSERASIFRLGVFSNQVYAVCRFTCR